jgi:exodeoxyribonuclease V alpha subunit
MSRPADYSAAQLLADAEAMLATLEHWAAAGWLRWLDVELARFLYSHSPAEEPASPALLLAAALCSHQNGHGHACLDLDHCLLDPDHALLLPPDGRQSVPDILPATVLACLTPERWVRQLHNSALVGSGAGCSPLVLVNTSHQRLLYLRRYWEYEQCIRSQIELRLTADEPIAEALLRDTLQVLFDRSHADTATQAAESAVMSCDWQKIACALAVRNRFAIITGGPGTGKTTTVVKLLAALSKMHSAAGQLRIRLAAPTGKAAVRLSESISSQIDNLPFSSELPREVSTIHRLLGPLMHSRRFRHNRSNPLPADVVVIDEASMVDIELFAQLLDALPAHCRLILLGDKDQLASVEAGAVLGNLCQRAADGHYLPATADWIQDISAQTVPEALQDACGVPLDQAITMLRFSHRYGKIPGIGALASAVNQQSEHLEELFDGRYPELMQLTLGSTQDAVFRRLVLDSKHGYGEFLALVNTPPVTDHRQPEVWTEWALRVLTAFGRFRILAAVRASEFGTEALNQRIEQLLRSTGRHAPKQVPGDSTWYSGRPVMLTRNDYNLKLMNGDIGIALMLPGDNGQARLRVAFPSTEPGSVRWVSPARLQAFETAFAMTVHKSQGSEFAHTALVLPAFDSPVLTRELVYTAVTRASGQFTLVQPRQASAQQSVLQNAVRRRVLRTSGSLTTTG